MKHIVQLSGGKDSTAMLLMMLERNMPVDEIIFCDTGMEFPELYRHIDYVEKHIGRKITCLHPEHSFEYYLCEKVIVCGPNTGKHGLGWPRPWRRWCTRAFKERLARDYLRERYAGDDVIKYVGIAYDEPKRHCRKTKDVQHPLYDWQITEAQALEYCKAKGFDFGGLYDRFNRLGCWCCPLQRISTLRKVRHYYPDLWAEILRMDKKAPYSFLPRYTAAQLERRFALEDAQGQLWGDDVNE